jgi:hypothetical protein
MGARRCAWTFDDGPDPVWTPAVLESLAEQQSSDVLGSWRSKRQQPRPHGIGGMLLRHGDAAPDRR